MNTYNYIALYNSEGIISIEKNHTSTVIHTNKLSIVESDKYALIQMLLAKGFTQTEIDEKMPVEETDE